MYTISSVPTDTEIVILDSLQENEIESIVGGNTTLANSVDFSRAEDEGENKNVNIFCQVEGACPIYL